MSVAVILKVFSDCCVCFAILAAFPTVFVHSYSLLLPALLCGCAAGLSAFLHQSGRTGLSRLCALLPLLSLLIADVAGEKLILLPVIIYTAVVLLRAQFDLEYYTFRQYFLRSLVLLGALYLCLCAFSVMEALAPSEESAIDAQATLRFGIVHLICGIVLQRQLRLGLGSLAQGNKAQLAAMAGGAGAVALGFIVAEPMLRKGAAAVFELILSLVLSAILAVLELFSSLLDQVELDRMYEEVAQRREDFEPVFGAVVAPEIQQAVQESEETRSLWWLVLVAVILLAAVTLMLMSFRRNKAVVASEEIVTRLDIPDNAKKESRRSNRGKIRHCYREFLRTEKRRGLDIRKYYTTEDILQRISSDTDAEAASVLRRVYLPARYNSDCEITREMAEEAKAALKKTRSVNKEDK